MRNLLNIWKLLFVCLLINHNCKGLPLAETWNFQKKNVKHKVFQAPFGVATEQHLGLQPLESLLPKGRRLKRLWPGCEKSDSIFLALLRQQEMAMSYGRAGLLPVELSCLQQYSQHAILWCSMWAHFQSSGVWSLSGFSSALRGSAVFVELSSPLLSCWWSTSDCQWCAPWGTWKKRLFRCSHHSSEVEQCLLSVS